MVRSPRLAGVALVAFPLALAAQQPAVPTPADVLGFTPGDDYQIADYTQLLDYFRKLDAASDRVRVEVVGKTTEGRDMIVAVITAPENFATLDRYRLIARRLASGRLSDEEARALAKEGKAIVWIDSGLHALETGSAQHAFLLAYQMATDESDEVRRIRHDVILVQMPCVEPDGLDTVAYWYRKTVHTPYQDSPMPWLFGKYISYDNNRDYFMQTQAESQVVSRLLYQEWLPQIVYNHHQGFYPARIFVPPFPDPFNPNIDPGILRGIELVGAGMQHRFEQEGKDGVLSRYGFSSWYNGSLRTTTYFHNMIGILTETTHDTPSPFFYDPQNLPARFGNGWSTREPSTNYPRPWPGGWIHFHDVLDYMLTGSMAVLDVASRYREDLLYRVHQVASHQIALGTTQAPVAYVIPPAQHDPPVAGKLIEVLMRGGVEVQRADGAFTAGGRGFPAGSYVISLAQAYRPFIKDLLEPQRYPDIRAYPGGPPAPPYDNAGWTLSYQMGVQAVPIAAPFSAPLSAVTAYPPAAGTGPATPATAEVPRKRFGYALDPRENNAATAVQRLERRRIPVWRASADLAVGDTTLPPGALVFPRGKGADSLARGFATGLGLAVHGLDARPGSLVRLTQRRIGIYRSWATEWVDDWVAGEGWARWMFDQYEIPHRPLVNADLRAGNLRAAFDVILIPDQALEDILHGYHAGRRQFELPHQTLPPPEYQGGIEAAGVAALKAFVEQGGTLILVDRACDLGTEELGLPVRNVLAGLKPTEFFAPGSMVRARVDSTAELGYGMPAEADVFFRKSRAFDVSDPSVRSVVTYGSSDLLRSGWLVGEDRMAGKAAVVELPVGRGRVVLLGFTPYFRGQTHGTFKLLFNALY
jgi:hypothetical protein